MRNVWWLHPGKLVYRFLVPLYLFIVYVVPAEWPQLLVLKGADYIQGPLAVMGLLMLGLFGLFGFIGSRVSIERPPPNGYLIDPFRLGFVGVLTVTAYVIGYLPIVARGQLLAREELNMTPGITSFTQMGVPFTLCLLYCRFTTRQAFPRPIRWLFSAVIFLSVARVFIWGERLALIELVIPASLLLFTYRFVPRTPGQRALHGVVSIGGPFFAIFVLLVMFGFTEYFRSWQTYSQTQSRPLVEFMTSRVVTYYFTALNNGAGMLATRMGDWPTYNFLFTAEWLYRLPLGIGAGLHDTFIGTGEHPDAAFLNAYADVEFNNMSGIFPIAYDLGWVGAAVYFCIFGTVAGTLYRSMVTGGKIGGLLYPPVFLGTLEVMRESYLNGPRVVLLFLGAIFLLTQLRPARPPVSQYGDTIVAA
jgi:hypothetical protein